MAQAASKSTSTKRRKTKKAKKSPAKKSDGFLVLIPMCLNGDQEFPVLNTFNNCVVFTRKHRLNRWKTHYQIDIARVKRYDSVAKIPRLIKTLMTGRRPKGLAADPNPITANQYDMAFVSKASDLALTDDVENIASFIKTVIVETEAIDPEVKDVDSGE